MEKDSSIDETSCLTNQSSTSSSVKSSTSSRGSHHHKCKSIFLNIEQDSVKAHRCSGGCIGKYPIHHAARMGDFDELKRLLEDPNCPSCPFQPDECLQRTPLHYACATGNVEKGLVCLKLLLECKQLKCHPKAAEKTKGYVNHLDYQRKSALHLAAENEATQIVIELLTNQANFDISSVDGKCALRDIYKNTPDAMEEALNQSIAYTESCSRPEYETDDVSTSSNCGACKDAKEKDPMFDFARTCVNVCLDFYPVIGSAMSKEEVECYQEAKITRCSRNKLTLAPETGFLYTVNRKRMRAKVRRQIMTNVLVQAFLHFKWQKIKRFCFVAIFFHIIWLSLYIATVINVFVLTCPHATKDPQNVQMTSEIDDINNENRTESESADNLVGPQFCKPSLPTQLGAGILLLLSVTVTIKEFFQFCRLRSIYLRFENLGQCMLLIFIFMTIPTIYVGNLAVISPLHYQISAFGIFLGWTLFLCQLAKLPRFRICLHMFGRKGMIVFPDHGIYVEILSRVFKNFLIFITIFSSLLISFVFSFNILLPNSTGFTNLTNAMVKVLTMMTGELNYDDIFHSEDSKLVYPVSSHVMYAIFIMVATIILFNLLIGFTVSDIQGLQKDAEINQISNKLEQIFLMECFLLTRVMQTIFRIYAKLSFRGDEELLNRIMVVKTTYATALCYHTRIKVIPFHLRVRIRDHASKNCLAISDYSGVARSKIFENRLFEH